MPKISTRVTFDKAKAIAKIKACSSDALTDMGNQALQNITPHVPKDQGTLQASGFSNSENTGDKVILRWSTPYAQYLWNGDVMYGNPTNRTYGPEKLNFTEALAREEWAKYAKDVYGEEWKRVYQASLKRRLRQ